MESTNQLEAISKLRQRLIRLIKLGEPNQPSTSSTDESKKPSIDRTAEVEECVRRLFQNSSPIEIFIRDVQRILNVTIKSSLTAFLIETIPLAQQYLQQHQYDPRSWETFKTISLQSSSSAPPPANPITRLPSLQQARFRLPPSCPQLSELASSTRSAEESALFVPNIRADADLYQQKLIHRFAREHFHLSDCGERLILQTLSNFLRHLIQRTRFYTEHRTDARFSNCHAYEITSNVREQIRFLNELNNLNSSSSMQRKTDLIEMNEEEQKRTRSREHRLSMIEELRYKEANEMACHVLRESRLKRQKLAHNSANRTSARTLRANLQDLLLVMEDIPILKRSKTLLYAYANR